MSPTRFRIVKHLSAALFAAAMAGLFLLGVDGLLHGVNELTRVFAAPPAAAPVSDPGATPGVVSTFIVPANGAASGEAASREQE